MKQKAWKKKITEACEEAGTYLPQFDGVIDSLAKILEMRDGAQAEFEAAGSKVTVRTVYRGAEVLKKHPAVAVIHECNTQALAYWRDLGLTTKGYVAVTGERPNEEKERDSFAEMLSGAI